MLQREATYRDVIDTRLLRIEHRPVHVDLDVFFVGVDAFELRPDRSLHFVRLREPERVFASGLEHFFLLRRLVQPVTPQIYGTGVMDPASRMEPVAADDIPEGIRLAEETVEERHLPGVVLHLLPPLHHFRSFDRHLLTWRGLVHDPIPVGRPAAWRVDPLTVNALMDGDHVAGLGLLRRRRDVPQGLRRRTVTRVVALHRDVIFTSGGVPCGRWTIGAGHAEHGAESSQDDYCTSTHHRCSLQDMVLRWFMVL